MTVCNRYTTYDARIKCDDNLTANMNKIIDEKKEGDAECYRRFSPD